MYFSTNFTLGIRTKDLHSIVNSRRPVVVPIECTPAFDLSGGWGFNPHWLKMTPTLVTENLCLGGRLRPPSPDPAWTKAGHHSAMDKRTGKQQKPVFLQTHQKLFLPERDYVTFGSLLSQFRLSSVCLSVVCRL